MPPRPRRLRRGGALPLAVVDAGSVARHRGSTRDHATREALPLTRTARPLSETITNVGAGVVAGAQ